MNFVITGASSGIGYQLALKLAIEGHTVFAIARRKALLEKLSSEILMLKPGAKIHLLAGDITSESFLDDVAKEISHKEKSINILVNNAGTLINKPFEQLTSSDWKNVYSTNVFAIVDLIRKLLPLFSKTEKNHIINISSMGGFQGSAKFKGLSAYSSSKAALAGITECLAEEFKDRNIAVNCLCMGSVQTEMFSAAFPDFKAATSSAEAAKFIAAFAIDGPALFNGKIIPVSNSTP
ncbi:MAG: SDR family oxidoreductase [Bacteroidetes bacterium]|nr:SDR family oxidoreductase [Bacteroidota bacterium]